MMRVPEEHAYEEAMRDNARIDRAFDEAYAQAQAEDNERWFQANPPPPRKQVIK